MSLPRAYLALAAMLSAWTAGATAQQSPLQPDSARAQIHTSLRAFYFNLAHQDWEALTADILAAKVIAHRPAPEGLVLAAAAAGVRSAPAACLSNEALVDQAAITLDGNWAEVSVPRCGAALAGADEFRLIHYEERWRFVYIDLYEEAITVSTKDDHDSPGDVSHRSNFHGTRSCRHLGRPRGHSRGAGSANGPVADRSPPLQPCL